jgi:hypothetical protein
MAADPLTVDRDQTVSQVRFLLANERIHRSRRRHRAVRWWLLCGPGRGR